MKNEKIFLRGFALDMPPGGCYLWKYMFPLFSNYEFINLTFGYRVEGGHFDFFGASESQILDAILSKIDDNSDFSKGESLKEFLSFIDNGRISHEARAEAMALSDRFINADDIDIEIIVRNNKRRYSLT
jgi:hypothetical protein